MFLACTSYFDKFQAQGSYKKIILTLSALSNQHQISPWNINALKNTVDMRITDMITHDEFA